MRGFEAYPKILIGIPCHCVGGTTGKAVGAVAVYIWIRSLIRICFIIRKITLHEHGNLSANIAATRGEHGMSLMYISCLFRAEVHRLQE